MEEELRVEDDLRLEDDELRFEELRLDELRLDEELRVELRPEDEPRVEELRVDVGFEATVTAPPDARGRRHLQRCRNPQTPCPHPPGHAARRAP